MHRLTFAAALLVLSGCKALVVPAHDFDDKPAPPPPDYSRKVAWAALPDRDDDADVVPAGEADRQATAAVDAFFIHPTTYYSKEGWNQPLDDAKTNETTDEKVLRNQASAFNEAARVYAPRYRQATLGTFMTQKNPNAVPALDLAYRDVLAAFDYYLEHYNKGRPIIIASHSQGSYHAVRLLADRFAGKPLAHRLVAAYPIGFAVPKDHFKRTLAPISPCKSENDFGCLVTWSTWKEGAETEHLQDPQLSIPYGDKRESNDGKALHCTNPLTWRTDSKPGGAKEHVGAVRFRKNNKPPKVDRHHVLSARCGAKGLFVEQRDRKYSGIAGNLHVVDYSVFYMDIRKNAVARATAFLAKRSGEAGR